MAVKPDRVQSKQVFAYVNSTPTRRIQSLDWASNFTTDSVFELGNAGIVEDSVSLVETAITLNSNEWGSTDLEAMMFGTFQQRNIRGNNSAATIANTTTKLYIAGRGAGGVWTALATSDWIQVIRLTSKATTNVAEFTQVTALHYTTSTNGRKLTVATVSPALSAAPATGDLVTLVNKYTITQDTVDSNPVHLVLPHRYSSTATTIMHSVALPRCYVDNLSYRIDTGGAAEANYSLVGEEERVTLNSRRELQTITGSFSSYTNATVIFTCPKDSRSVTGSPYMLYAGSNLVEHSTYAFTHTSAQVTFQARIGAGLNLDRTTPLVYYFTNKTKRGYKGLTNITSSIGKVTKGYIDVYMKVGSGTDTKLQRVTGVDISVPLTRESIDELGTSRSLAKPLEGNLRNELTLTFNRNDMKEYAQMLGLTLTDATTREIKMTDLKSVKNVQITLKFYNSPNTHSAVTLLKTMTFSDCSFIGDNSTTPISGASGLELKFSTQSVNFVGSGVKPVYTTT